VTVIQSTLVAGVALVAADVTPAEIAATRRALDPTAPYEQDPAIAADLATIRRITAWLPTWQQHGAADLEWRLRQADAAEDRLLAAHGHRVPTSEQRYQARQVMGAAGTTIQAVADLAHPVADCSRCRAWKDCLDADRAYRDALHADWANRWATSAGTGDAAGPVVVEFYRDHQLYTQRFASEPAALEFLAAGEQARALVGWTLIRSDGSRLDLSGLESLPAINAA
jgi:hypothetical protein